MSRYTYAFLNFSLRGSQLFKESGAPEVPIYPVRRDIAGPSVSGVHKYWDLVIQVRSWKILLVKYPMSRNLK